MTIRTLKEPAKLYEKYLLDMLENAPIDIEYTVKLYADNYFTVTLERTDLRNADDDVISLELIGNYDCVYPAVEAWLESEESR